MSILRICVFLLALFLFKNSFVFAEDQNCQQLGEDMGITTQVYGLNEPTVETAEYLKCYFGAIDVDISQGQRCCKVPRPGAYGGHCLDPAKERKSYGLPKALTSLVPDAKSQCGPIDIVCMVGGAVKTAVVETSKALRNMFVDVSKLPDYALACNQDGGVPIISDPNFDPDTGIIKSDTPCWCVDEDNIEATSTKKLCYSYILGTESREVGKFATPSRYSSMFVVQNVSNIQAKVNEDVRYFFTDASKPAVTWQDKIRTATDRQIPKSIRDKMTLPKYDYLQKEFISCLACANYSGFPSAIGCLPLDSPNRFIAEVAFGIGVSIGGATCLFGIIVGAIQFQLSGGDSAKIQKAQKMIVNFIIGFLVILFSMLILRFIGVNVLRIYGLS